MKNENLPTNFSLYPLLWLAVGFSLGILAARFSGFGWAVFSGLSLTFAVFTLLFQKQGFVCAFLLFSFAAAGGFCFRINDQIAPHRLKKLYDENQIKSGEPLEIEGILQGRPELAAGGFFLELKAKKATYKGDERIVSGKIRLFAPLVNEQISAEYDQLNLQYGSKIRVAGHFRREDNFLNPGVILQREILDQKDIDATGIIKSPLLIEKLGDEQVFAPMAWIYEQRENLIIDFNEKFSRPTAGILTASLLGNRYFLDKQTAEVFREGGTFHVLVISGLHITFIGGLTLLFVRFLTNKKFWQFVIAAVFLWAYSLAVGAEVPVIRATIMFTILLFSQVIFRNGTLLNSLGFCALILLVWRPQDLFSPSFHLTFVSVTAIVAFAFPLIDNLRKIGSWMPSVEMPFPPNVSDRLKRFCEMLYWRENVWEIESKRQIWLAKLFKSPYLKWFEAGGLQGVFRYLFEGILVSLIVQVWLLPLTVYYFHRFSMIGVMLNLWVGFFIALESFAALTAVLLTKISDVLALPFIQLTEIFNWFLLFVPDILVENGWASVRIPVYSGQLKAVYFLYFAPILVITFLLNKWNPFGINQKSKYVSVIPSLCIPASFFLIFAAIIIFHPFSAPNADGRLHVDFLDVGQGDSALVTFPDGQTLLIDGGGKVNFQKKYNRNGEDIEIFEPDIKTVGESVVSEFLWERGLAKVDYILATHADADHIQGLAAVAENFRLKSALFGRTPQKDGDFTELLKILQKRNVPVLKVSRGDVLSFGKAQVEILYPDKDDSPDAVSDNNHSVVLRIIYGNKKILFTGDIEKETETELLKMPEFLPADVIKVAHHGSRTSSTQEFINAVQAEYAIIPVGRSSSFGHPHREVVERWLGSGIKVLTTGERGTISISTDGEDLRLDTFVY